MKTLLFILIFAFSAFGQNIIATTEDGKKVILKPNGTWEYMPQQEKQDVPYSRPTENIENNKLTLPIKSDKFEDLIEFFSPIQEKFKKTEFETATQYLARIQKLADEEKFNGKPLKDTFLILPLTPTYNAEKQTFAFDWLSIAMIEFKDIRHRLFFVEWSGFWSRGDITVPDVKILPDKAPQLKSEIKLAVIGFPVEVAASQLSFRALKAIIFNEKTGEIYAQKNF